MRFVKQPRHVSLYALKRDRPFISMHKPLIYKKISSTQKHNFMLFLPIPRTDYQSLVLVKIAGSLSYNVHDTKAKVSYRPSQYQDLTT